MIEAFYGREGMPIGIVVDQLGTYLVLSTIGILLICFCERARDGPRDRTADPHLSAANRFDRRDPAYPGRLSRLGELVAGPPRLDPGFAGVGVRGLVGLQLRFSTLPGNRGPLAMGIGYKLVLGPLLILLLYRSASAFVASTEVTLFEAAMAPQVGGSIVAFQYGLNAKLISLMVGLGTVLSFITLVVWWQIFQRIAVN